MNENRIVIIGTSAHAKVVADIILSSSRYTLCGFVSSDESPNLNFQYRGFETLGSDSDLPCLVSKMNSLCAVLGIGNGTIRKKVLRKIEKICPALAFVPVIDSSAIISSSARIGPGCVIAPGAIVNASAVVGAHSLINTGSSVDHDVTIGTFVSIAPGVVVGGSVDIGHDVTIGLGTKIFQNISIPCGTVLGGGSLVINSLPSPGVYYGAPASKIRELDNL